MELCFICAEEEFLTDRTLATVAARAAAEGILLAGLVQPLHDDRPRARCDIVIALLPDGERRKISMDLGPGATACRLDAGALEQAVVTVLQRMPQAQGLIVNKFGKQEAAGRGLVPAIAEAAARGLPVLVGVSPAWRAAFLEFSAGAAREMPADAEQIHGWLAEMVQAAA